VVNKVFLRRATPGMVDLANEYELLTWPIIPNLL
jgi:hypothetical protein